MSTETAYGILQNLIPSPEEDPEYHSTEDYTARMVDLTHDQRFPWKAFMRSFPAGKEILNYAPDYCMLYWNHETSARCLWVGNTNKRESCHAVHVGKTKSTCQRL